MAADLRSFLSQVDDLITRVTKEVDPQTQMGTLCSQSPGPIVFERLTGHPGAYRHCPCPDEPGSNCCSSAVIHLRSPSFM